MINCNRKNFKSRCQKINNFVENKRKGAVISAPLYILFVNFYGKRAWAARLPTLWYVLHVFSSPHKGALIPKFKLIQGRTHPCSVRTRGR